MQNKFVPLRMCFKPGLSHTTNSNATMIILIKNNKKVCVIFFWGGGDRRKVLPHAVGVL